MRRALLLAALLASSPALLAQEEAPPGKDRPARRGSGPSRLTLGGSVGFGFGTVTWVGVSGEVGYLVTDRLWAGVSGMYRYTDDRRYEPSFTATDYGVGTFGRYFFFDRVFGSVEWAWTSYEARTFGSDRETITSVFVGGGYGQPVSGNGSIVLEVLYDVTGNAKGVYGTPWVLRAGFTYGF